MTGSLALSLESSSSRMHRIGRAELTLGAVPDIDEVVARVEAINDDDVARGIDRVLSSPSRTLAVAGPPTEHLPRPQRDHHGHDEIDNDVHQSHGLPGIAASLN